MKKRSRANYTIEQKKALVNESSTIPSGALKAWAKAKGVNVMNIHRWRKGFNQAAKSPLENLGIYQKKEVAETLTRIRKDMQALTDLLKG